MSNIATKEFVEDLILEIAQAQMPLHDPIACECSNYINEQKIPTIWRVAKMTTCELYRIGAIGIKTDSQDRFIYSHQDLPVIGEEIVDATTRIHIHPMLHRALNLSEH